MRESSQAREAFDLYLSLGPQRSLAKVGQQLGKSTTILERWSKAHAWQERIAAHEKKLAAQAAAEEAEERRKARKARLGISYEAQDKVLRKLRATPPEQLSVREAVALLHESWDAQRKDLGEPDQRVEHSGSVDVDVSDARAQLAGRLARLAARLGAPGAAGEPD